ncbi:Negative regulator of differentiation 1 [Choanephora cucurbitarum]|uniref:Negative regulator of differentiation 1 n=1 Tax=Choanephora cucurbitarum TaxID=101091 RepID=A0A1C7NWC5_9FUNG|nr:Negative regulator of differentiation 1 [Choanephora cucurbitarum]
MKRFNKPTTQRRKKPRYYDDFNDELAQYGLLTQYGSTPLKANEKAEPAEQALEGTDELDIYLPAAINSDDEKPEPIPYTYQPPPPPHMANMTTPMPFEAANGYMAHPLQASQVPQLGPYGYPRPPPPPPHMFPGARPPPHIFPGIRPPHIFPGAHPPMPLPPPPMRPAGVSALNATAPPPTSSLNSSPNRTIYLGNVTEELTSHDILQCVHQGALEQFRMSKERFCAFLTFLDANAANAFYQTYTTKKFIVKGVVLQVNWGSPKAISSTLQIQIEAGATRNVYLGRLLDTDTEEVIRTKVKKFGPIEHIRIIKPKKIAFVHFLSILSAIKCNSVLPLDPEWKDKTVGYGRDHCTDVFTQYNSALGIVPQKLQHSDTETPYEPLTNDMEYNLANVRRTVYFGNIHPDAGCEDLCNVIKGGNVLMIRFFKATQNAFVTFFDEESAERVYEYFEKYQLSVRGRKLKLGWGKPSTISPRTAFAIKNGATRNLYIGGIDTSIYTAEKLRQDFSDYGETEQVNVMKEQMTGFVNFLSLNDAMTAIVAIKTKPEYADIKISYGKDRCGNKPKITKSMENRAAKRLMKLQRREEGVKAGDEKKDAKKNDEKKDDVEKDDEKKDDAKKEDEKKDDAKNDDVKKDDEKKDDEKKDDEKKDDEKKDDEKKDDEKKDDEKKDDEKKDDEKKDDEKKDDENELNKDVADKVDAEEEQDEEVAKKYEDKQECSQKSNK